MKSKVLVYGKSQSRTALGIVNAFLKLYPDSSRSDLQKAFPKSLNPKSFTDNIIVPEKETIGFEKQFFEKEDELVVLKNGEKLALVELWTKEDFDAICEHAKQYGIEVAEIEGTKPFEKGSFELKYLDGYIPPEEGKQECPFEWWRMLVFFVALLILLLLICWLKCKNCDKPSIANITPMENLAPAPSEPSPVKEVEEKSSASENNTFTDGGDYILIKLPDGKEWKIAKNSTEYQLFEFLNSDQSKVDADDRKGWINLDKVRFESGKTDLSPEAVSQLETVAILMKKFPNIKIKVGGHSDNTGNENTNITLSSERAKVSAEKIISFGIEKNRVTSAGYGSQYPACPENNTNECKAANRRIDVKVIQKL